MLLQARELEVRVADVRCGAAVLRNRLVRLDNPVTRQRMAAVAALARTVAAVGVASAGVDGMSLEA
jgi:hypothetical protein